MKEQADLLETVTGIDSLDNEKKMEFAQAIGRQGGATSAGAGASMGAGAEKWKRGSGDIALTSAQRLLGRQLAHEAN